MKNTKTKTENDAATVDRLVSDNMALCHWFVRKYRQADPHEALSAAMDGLATAARKYDPSRGTFGHFASTMIEWKFGQHWDRLYAKKRGARFGHASLEDVRTMSGGKPRELHEVVADDRARHPAHRLVADEDRRALAAGLSALRPRDAAIVRLAYGVGREAVEPHQIAARLGVSRQRVHQLLARAVAELRAMASDVAAGRRPARVPRKERVVELRIAA